MKVLAVVCAMMGITGFSMIPDYPDEALFYVVLSVLFLFAAFKLWTKKKKPKKNNQNVVAAPVNPYMDMDAPLEPIEFNGIIVRGDEKVYFAIPAETFVNKTRVTGYQSESYGGTVRVAKGLSVGNRKRETHAVRENVNDIKGKGDYVVTNKRVVFVGLGDSFDISLENITSVSMVADNGFVILANGKAYNITAGVPGTQYACNATLEIINRFL